VLGPVNANMSGVNRPFASLPPPSNGSGYGVPVGGHSGLVNSAASMPTSSVLDLNRSLMKDVLCLQDATTNVLGEKPLLPCNFISNTRGTMSESAEVVHMGDSIGRVR
jgi:hypothetical protein